VYRSKLPLGSPGKLTISFYLYPIPEGAIHAFTWQLPVRIGSNALLQTSINLRDWDLVTPVANDGTIVDWYHSITGSQRFFRAIPE
jgi:hypothetical protein